MRFAPHALELVAAKLEERERKVASEAMRELNDGSLTPQQALEHWMAIRETRRLRKDLETGVRLGETLAKEHAEALSQ